jgi:hypothetical protein
MNFQILAILSLFLLLQNSGTIYAENIESEIENSSLLENIRSPSNSKIHSILIQWQLSDNPNEFAKQNNLSFTEDKIAVYIHLKSVEFRSSIPKGIQITAFDEKIVAAFVSSGQLDKLEKLDFVEGVTPPDFARTPPIPKVEIPQSQTLEENQYDYLIWIVIVGIVITAIGILKKLKD